MVRPLDDADDFYLGQRKMSDKVARRLSRKCPSLNYDDLRDACWVGVFMGVKTFDPSRGDLDPYLMMTARSYGTRYIRAAVRRGMTRLPQNLSVMVVEMTEADAVILPATASGNSWRDEDWKAVISELAPFQRGPVEWWFRFGRCREDIRDEFGFATVNAVSAVISRAVNRLRKKLTPELL